jgi:aryl sulfotransferase
MDALVFSPKAKYIYVGRDGRDCLWSWHNHYLSFTEQAYELVNNRPDRVGPPLERSPEDVVHYFRQWLDGKDLPGQMRRIADFLEIEIEEPLWPKLVEHCSLDHMRKASSGSPLLQLGFKHGASDFFYRGTNGRWRDLLTADDLEKYERVVRERLTPECAR